MFPPQGAVAIVNLEGCPGCGNGEGGAFYWKMEDGSSRPALAGLDDLEDAGVAVLSPMKRNMKN
jgi:hypothetical protein